MDDGRMDGELASVSYYRRKDVWTAEEGRGRKNGDGWNG